MASKRRVRRKSCTGKVQHSEVGAVIARKKYVKLFGDKMGTYKCPFCGKYHVGHVGGKVWVV